MKTFYQTDVCQDGNIWTSSVTYSGTIEEHEHAVLLELANDWSREGLVVPEFDQETWEREGTFEAVLESINADGSTLTVEPVAALAKMKLLDVDGLDVDAIVASREPVKLVQPTSTVRVYYGAFDGENGTESFATTSKEEFENWQLGQVGATMLDFVRWSHNDRTGEDADIDEFLRQNCGHLDTWSSDTFDVAADERAAVAACRAIERTYGEAVDADDDIRGSDAVDWLRDIIGDVRGALAAKPKPKPIRVVVGVDGGLVQGASADAPVELVVADYDVDTFDKDNPPMDVPQSGGDPVDGYLVEHVVAVDPEWVDAVFAANADAVGGEA